MSLLIPTTMSFILFPVFMTIVYQVGDAVPARDVGAVAPDVVVATPPGAGGCQGMQHHHRGQHWRF